MRQRLISPVWSKRSAGEESVIAKAGKGVARLVTLRGQKDEKRTLGLFAGRLKIPADFDAPLPADVLDRFEAR